MFVSNIRDIKLVIANGKKVVVNIVENWIGENSVRCGRVTESGTIVKVTLLESKNLIS